MMVYLVMTQHLMKDGVNSLIFKISFLFHHYLIYSLYYLLLSVHDYILDCDDLNYDDINIALVCKTIICVTRPFLSNTIIKSRTSNP